MDKHSKKLFTNMYITSPIHMKNSLKSREKKSSNKIPVVIDSKQSTLYSHTHLTARIGNENKTKI